MNFKYPIFIILSILLMQSVPHEGAKGNKKTKSVTTHLDAKWNATPIVLEVAEYLADENIDSFWNFVDAICNLEKPLVEIENDKERYEVVISVASKFLSGPEISLLKFGLSLHIYSPKVEMFDQMAKERNLPECDTVADIGGKLACGVEEMNTIIKQTSKGKIGTFNLDHHFIGSENNSLSVVLYGELGTAEFARFHRAIKQHVLSGKIDYVIRHFVKSRPNRRLRLSGYGVELQMKSTEYKAEDDTKIKEDGTNEDQSSEDEDEEVDGFNVHKLKTLYPDMASNLDKFRQFLIESSSEMAPLKVWQFQELSLQAAERIMQAPKEEALHVLTYISQNFPMQAKSLVRTVVNNDLKKEIKLNQELFSSNLNLQPSDTALFINGMFFDLDIVDIISLFEVIRQEQRVMQGLHNIGVSNKRMSALLELDLNEASSGGQEFAIDIRDSAINWINDLETDSKYRGWGSSLMDLLRPTFPGMLRNIRKNLYNLVLIINPASLEAKPLLKLAESFVVHLAPLRVGIVFAVNDSKDTMGKTDADIAMLCAYNYVAQNKDPEQALGFLTEVYSKFEKELSAEDVISIFKELYPRADIDDVFSEDSDYDFGRHLAKDFVQRTGLTTPSALMNGIPLLQSQLNADEFEEAVLTEVMQQTPVFQKAIYRGEFSDRHNTVDYLMDKPNVMPRLNQRILTQESSQFLDMTGSPVKLDVSKLLQASNRDLTATAVENFKYFSISKKENTVKMLTFWVIGDLNCARTRDLLASALAYAKSNSESRVAFIPNVQKDKPGQDQLLNKIALASVQALTPAKALSFMLTMLREKEIERDLSKYPDEIRAIVHDQEIYLKMLRVYCQRVLSFGPGQRGVVANGRVLGPLNDDETLDLEDFVLLERHSMSSYGDKILKALKKLNDEDDSDLTSNQMLRLIPLLVSRPQSRSRFEINFFTDDYSVLKLPAANPSKPAFEIAAIVDPVSRGAQKLGPILNNLQMILNCNIRVFLNSVDKCSDMPLKSFYRFVLEPEVLFTVNGAHSPGPIARFSGMPTAPLLTQNMHVPENWLVNVVRAVHDLDNIRLEDVESVVHSEYELEYLLLEGHCFETTTGAPPRGLQVTLGTESNPVLVDTIVMANLGYFQLKANPGAWILRLRQGRSADIYDIISHEGSDTPANSKDIKVVISSLRSNILKLKVAKKPDMKHMDLLGEEKSNSGIWNSITSSFGSGTDEEQEEKINIFSVASGHLYERFLKIMMLSVLKHTKTPVKFWFLKNYLSPQFKDFLPIMAKNYGFEYSLVEYKWPRWLHQQTEKQRIIWGYKILFLDVLFPLDVKKIIFVDADQVVRADMKELRDLDLGGAPYAYTPFCDSRTEMDGFRFWKQGYWRNHLQGRRYHISALYVVDLKRFRRIAAGDRLRGQYQALSQDRNSLSNLDQDLPNNMIHQVAIKSLPQEWLWCETWCDDESKKYAKTIDLCNNPMTKEAKLNAAVRIVEEWKDYDNEIRKLQQQLLNGELIDEIKESSHSAKHSEL